MLDDEHSNFAESGVAVAKGCIVIVIALLFVIGALVWAVSM